MILQNHLVLQFLSVYFDAMAVSLNNISNSELLPNDDEDDLLIKRFPFEAIKPCPFGCADIHNRQSNDFEQKTLLLNAMGVVFHNHLFIFYSISNQ